MKIERKNIIDLIGKSAGKYHSCIITCFSLDFSYFEERVLPSLRVANIKNVNLFCDGYYLESAQEMVSGSEFKHNKTYNFVPIYETGVFHPKIMFFAGQKNGLLIIGSGNVTSSGLSTNDEIWAAFHINTVETENAMVFSHVWNYLEGLFSNARGFIPEKLSWFRKYSTWINQLPKPVQDIKFTDSEINLNFISNQNGNSSYSQIKNLVTSDKIKTLTAISPFYDKNGSALTQIVEDFKPGKVNCIIESNDGTIPVNLPESFIGRISFFDWKNCSGEFNEKINRLHAKLLHFEYEDGSEAMFFGSANITEAALGMKGDAANGEAGILIKRKSGINWLKGLGIKIPKETFDIKTISNSKVSLAETLFKHKFKNRILYSEIQGSKLSIYLKDKQTEVYRLLVLDRDESKILVEMSLQGSDKITVKVNPENIFRIALIDEDSNIVSNYSFVHRVESLAHTNPDPNLADLGNLLNGEYPNFEGISKLLKHIDFSFADEVDIITKKTNLSYRESTRKNDERPREYKIADSADFVRSYDGYSSEMGVLNNSNVKIFSKLNTLLKFQGLEQEYTDNEEQLLLVDDEQEGKGGDVKQKYYTNNTENDIIFIKDYFRKLNKVLTSYIQGFYDEKSNAWQSPIKVDISLLSNILISLELVIIFQGKNTKNNTPFFTAGKLEDIDVTTIKGYLATTIGLFLMLCNDGFKSYESENLREVLENKKAAALARILLIVCNQNWQDSDSFIHQTIALNALHYLQVNEKRTDYRMNSLEEDVLKIQNESYYKSHYFEDNFRATCDLKLIYLDWLSVFKNIESRKKELIIDLKKLCDNDMIFGSRIGFCRFSKINYILEDQYKITVYRAGFSPSEKFVLKNLNYGSKAIIF